MSAKTDARIDRVFRLVMAAVVIAVTLAVAGLLWGWMHGGYGAPGCFRALIC